MSTFMRFPGLVILNLHEAVTMAGGAGGVGVVVAEEEVVVGVAVLAAVVVVAAVVVAAVAGVVVVVYALISKTQGAAETALHADSPTTSAAGEGGEAMVEVAEVAVVTEAVVVTEADVVAVVVVGGAEVEERKFCCYFRETVVRLLLENIGYIFFSL